MSSLLWCISSLAAVYFLVFSVLMIARLVGQLRRFRGDEQEPGIFQETFQRAELTVEFAPMLCVLFLAAQMQAIQTSHGREDPPSWIRRSMEVASIALVLQTLLTVLLPTVMGKPAEVDEDAGVVSGPLLIAEARSSLVSGEAAQVLKGAILAVGVVFSYAAFVALYCACACVCVGVMQKHIDMVEEFGLKTDPHVSAAVSCTVNLTILFFAVRLLLAAARIWGDIVSPRRSCSSKLFEVLKLATGTAFFAPMLCVLFMVAQLRAVQANNPVQPWAQVAFHACTWGVIVQTLLTIVLPYMPFRVDAKRGTSWMEGDVQFKAIDSERPAVAVVLALLRYIPMLFVCGGIGVVVISVIINSSPHGSRVPVPPSMMCSIVLAVQFFAVYLCLRVAVSLRAVTHGQNDADGGAVVKTFYAASATVHFCPMLAVIFVALRMRAQQISGQGRPQGWAQDAMILCTGAVIVQLLVCLGIGVTTGSDPEVDENESFHVKRVHDDQATVVDKLVIGVQAISLALLYGGATAVCVAMFILTPESSGAHGAVIRSSFL
jgi:hypothetical protein